MSNNATRHRYMLNYLQIQLSITHTKKRNTSSTNHNIRTTKASTNRIPINMIDIRTRGPSAAR